jgi:hypothetical protein
LGAAAVCGSDGVSLESVEKGNIGKGLLGALKRFDTPIWHAGGCIFTRILVCEKLPIKTSCRRSP